MTNKNRVAKTAAQNAWEMLDTVISLCRRLEALANDEEADFIIDLKHKIQDFQNEVLGFRRKLY